MKYTTESSRGRAGYFFSAILMVTAAALAAYTLRPDKLAKVSAADSNVREISIAVSDAPDGDGTSDLDGKLGFRVTGDSLTVTAGGNEIDPQADGSYHVELDGSGLITIRSEQDITSLVFDENADEVTQLLAEGSGLASVDFSHCVNLEKLNLSHTAISSVDFTGLSKLSYPDVSYTNIRSFEQIVGVDSVEYGAAEGNYFELYITPSALQDNGNGGFVIDEFKDKETICVLNWDTAHPISAKQSNGTYYFDYSDIFGENNTTTEEMSVQFAIGDEAAYPAILIGFETVVSNPSYGIQAAAAAVSTTAADDSAAAADTNTDTGTDTGTNTGTGSNTGTSANTDTGSNTGTSANTDTGSNTGTSANTGTGSNTGTSANTGTNSAASPSTDGPSTDTPDTVAQNADGSKTSSTNVVSSSDAATSSIVKKASINSAVFSYNNQTVAKKNVRVKAAATTDTDTMKTILDSVGVSSSNAVGYDISLIDVINNNKVSVSSGSVTITLDYPSTAVKNNKSNYQFKIYHHTGSNGSSVTYETLTGTPTDEGIQFTTKSFSLFVLTWTDSTGSSGTDTGKGDDGKGPETGEDDLLLNVSLMLAILSVVSFGVTALTRKQRAARSPRF